MAWSMKSIAKRYLNKSQQVQGSGLTLVECLVALFVIQFVVAASAPMIAIAVGTRVQNQFADQALQVAQGEIDKIKTAVARGENYKDEVAFISTNARSIADFSDGTKAPAPENLNPAGDLENDDHLTDVTLAKRVDFDGDGTADLAVQVFRNYVDFIDRTTPPPTVTELAAFDIGVRVYRAETLENFTAAQLSQNDNLEPMKYGLTARVGGRSPNPLVVLTASVFKSDTGDSLCDYYDYLNDTNDPTTGTDFQKPEGC